MYRVFLMTFEKIRIKLTKGGVKIIKRTILSKITDDLKNWTVVLITGARQVGKTTICNILEKELDYNYISLNNARNRFDALNDPDGFLETHHWPLIIDEVQYVPGLFDVIEGIVNEQKRQTGNNNGMYILTSSESYNLIQGVTQSMAGRVAIINVKPLSFNEINNLNDKPFNLDLAAIRSKLNIININKNKLFNYIYKGFNTLANKTNMPIGFKCIICLTNSIYSLGNDTYAIPIASI